MRPLSAEDLLPFSSHTSHPLSWPGKNWNIWCHYKIETHIYSFHFDFKSSQHILVRPLGSDIRLPSRNNWDGSQIPESSGYDIFAARKLLNSDQVQISLQVCLQGPAVVKPRMEMGIQWTFLFMLPFALLIYPTILIYILLINHNNGRLTPQDNIAKAKVILWISDRTLGTRNCCSNNKSLMFFLCKIYIWCL